MCQLFHAPHISCYNLYAKRRLLKINFKNKKMKIKIIFNIFLCLLIFNLMVRRVQAVELGQLDMNNFISSGAGAKFVQTFWKEGIATLAICALAYAAYSFWRKYAGKASLLRENQLAEELQVDSSNSVEKDFLPKAKGVLAQTGLNKGITNEVELSDEELLNRKELFDSAIEKEENDSFKVDEVKKIKLTDDEMVANDVVDSSLFFAADNFNKNDVEIAVDQEEKLFTIESQKPSLKPQPLKRNTDIQKPQAVISKNILEEDEFIKEMATKKEDEEIFEEDVITILGNKADVKSHFNMFTASLMMIIVALSVTIVYLLLKDKPEGAVIVNSDENEAVVSLESTVIEEKKDGVNVEETQPLDPLKMKIEVYNGSGVAGVAGKAKDFLTGKKYESVEAKNYSSSEVIGSTIYYQEEKLKNAAQELADILKDADIQAQVKLATTTDEKVAEIVVILGK